MKRTLSALIAGIVIGTASTAVAATQVYWHQKGPGYSCEGVASGVICSAGGYKVGVTPGYVFVQKNLPKHTYGCRKWQSWSSCESD